MTNTVGTGGEIGKGTWTTLSNPELKTGEGNTIVFAIERGMALPIPATVAIFVNGVKAFVFEGTITSLAFTSVAVGRGITSGTDAPWNLQGAEWSVDFAKGATIADVEELYKVPEPTALALLVLGGGLVLLKRRVA